MYSGTVLDIVTCNEFINKLLSEMEFCINHEDAPLFPIYFFLLSFSLYFYFFTFYNIHFLLFLTSAVIYIYILTITLVNDLEKVILKQSNSFLYPTKHIYTTRTTKKHPTFFSYINISDLIPVTYIQTYLFR